MNIIVEGPDNSGKSTLAKYLAASLYLPVDKGKGPPKTAMEWVRRFDTMPHESKSIIFDRHTAVSEPIYGPIVRGENFADGFPMLIHQFYQRRQLFIYCRGRTMIGHVPDHERDSEDHVKTVEKKYAELCSAYDRWAVEHAHIFYRIGDDMNCVLRMVRSLVTIRYREAG